MFWPVTVLQGSARSLYSVQVDASANIGVFLSSVGKCRTAKVKKEIRDTLFNDWGLCWRLHVSCTRVWMATIFGRQRKRERLIAQAVDAQLFLKSRYYDGRVGTQQPDGKSAVLHCSVDEIVWTCEKETTGIMEKRVDFVQDNSRAHKAMSAKQFLANKNITMLEHRPYSPYLASAFSHRSSQCSKEPILCR